MPVWSISYSPVSKSSDTGTISYPSASRYSMMSASASGVCSAALWNSTMLPGVTPPVTRFSISAPESPFQSRESPSQTKETGVAASSFRGLPHTLQAGGDAMTITNIHPVCGSPQERAQRLSDLKSLCREKLAALHRPAAGAS